MKHLILGTAGHIDHGKTSLVQALTGIDTDRLPEEKARGITIELGFAHLQLSPAIRLGIVDVPGHEKFVRTMVAGVGGMDMVMLVIAADEGIMPQTREHLDICRLLGIRTGIVALTKQDMVDPDWSALVTEEIRDYLASTFLQDAPIIPVSSRTGHGIDKLKQVLLHLAEGVEQKKADGPFRLPVDRSFTVAGFGAVATGTLLSGRIRVGDEVTILPEGAAGKVRTLQVHGKSVDTAEAGRRIAVNLQGISHSRIRCGDVIVPHEAYRTTRRIDARLHCLASASNDLAHRSMVRLHSATYEVQAQLILFDRNLLHPGDSVFAQLRLAHPVLLLPGDTFILRTHSPRTTVGGGIVLDPFPPSRRRRSAEALELLSCIETGDEPAIIRGLVAASLLSGATLRQLQERTGYSSKRIEQALSPLLSTGDLVQVLREPRTVISRDAFDYLTSRIHEALTAYLEQNRLKEGINKEELKTRIPQRSDSRFFPACLAALEKDGKVVVDRDLVKPAGEGRSLSGSETDIGQRMAELLSSGGIEPPTPRELAHSLGVPEKSALDHLTRLARSGEAVKVKSDLFYHPDALNLLKGKLLIFLAEHKEIAPAEFRDLTGLSRKFMIPVLEYFDAQKVTIRVGDKRILRGGTL